jgi:hypothetical protein
MKIERGGYFTSSISKNQKRKVRGTIVGNEREDPYEAYPKSFGRGLGRASRGMVRWINVLLWEPMRNRVHTGP